MMLRMRAILMPIVVVALACVPAARGQTVDYEIKLVRPPKVGEKYNLTADGALTRRSSYTVGGVSAGVINDGFGIHLEGVVEVLEVNKDGEESKSACTVSKCVRITADGESELLAAGRVVTATGGKTDTTYAVDQGELSADAIETLELVLTLGEDDGYNDDRIYGTTKRQPVGGSWELDTKAASDEAKADDVKFEPSDITGSLQLKGVEKVGEAECLKISGDTTIKQFTVEPPEGMKLDRASLKARYTGVYPVDVARSGPLREEMSVTHDASFRGKDDDGSEMIVKSTVQRATELKRTYIQK
jgi:hypothetical protein